MKRFYEVIIENQEATKDLMEFSDPNYLNNANKDIVNFYKLCARFLKITNMMQGIIFDQYKEIEKLKEA